MRIKRLFSRIRIFNFLLNGILPSNIWVFSISWKSERICMHEILRTWCSRQLAHQWEENARLKSIRGRSGSLSREKKVQKNRGWKRRFTSGRWKYDKAVALDHAVLHFDWMRWCETPKKTLVRLISAPIAGICMPISESRDVEPAKIARCGWRDKGDTCHRTAGNAGSVPTDKRRFPLIEEEFAMRTKRRVIGDSYWCLMIERGWNS